MKYIRRPYIYILLSICLAYGVYIVQIQDASISEHISPVKQVETRTIQLNFVGDILAARAIELTMRKNGYAYPFEKIQNILSNADITFANLETPLIGDASTGKTTPGGTTVFRGDVTFAQAMKDAGIDIVSLANNHMKDQGHAGLISTIQTLDNVGIAHAGAGNSLAEARRLRVVTVKDVRVGYLAYNDADVVPMTYHATDSQSGTHIMDIPRLQEDITRSRPQVDVLVVSMHSGTEYVTEKPNTRQTSFARAAIDAGADMVIGHHPHVLQPMEIYKGKYIFYSLGNFIFDQPWPDTKESSLVRMGITLTRYNNSSWNIDTYRPTIVPLVIQNFQPQETTDSAKQKTILERFTKTPHVFSMGGENIFVELATTSQARTQGLSYRKNIPKETGLLFIFDASHKAGIWMKDMLFPIDIYWFDSNFKLVDKRLSVATSTYPDVFYPKADALYVLETAVGAFSDMSLTDVLTGELTYIQSYDKR